MSDHIIGGLTDIQRRLKNVFAMLYISLTVNVLLAGIAMAFAFGCRP